MEHDKKLAFLQNMTQLALTHAASVPNAPVATGGMSHDKMLSFVSGMAKHGLQHFDTGGTALNGPTNTSTTGATTTGGWNGAVGNFLGTNNQYQAQGAPIQAGTNTAQLNNSYNQAQGALGQQQGITGVLNGGLGQGVGAQNQLSNMYLNQAQGQGPNPAQAALNQSTGQNIATQAALMAGQRGAGANAGLIARQAGQQGAAIQQNAVGQAATQQAQQQLAAENNLQNLSANQIAQGTGATQATNQATQNEQNILQGANTAYNNAAVSQQSNINNVNAGISTANQNNASNIVSGVGNLLSSVPVIGSLFAEGGEVTKDKSQVENKPMSNARWAAPQMMATGGISGQQTSGPQSYVGQWLNSNVDSQGPSMQPAANFNTNIDNPFGEDGGSKKAAPQSSLSAIDTANIASAAPELSTGAADLGGIESFAALAYKGGLMKNGGKVNPKNPSERAVKKGDSLENDKVPAMLSQGELVIDRDTMKDPGPMGQMARALEKHISQKNKSKNNRMSK